MNIGRMSSEQKKSKIIVILGTTASGKTSLGVALARQFNGEIISADSRQVYRGLDVGSGKDLIEYGQPLPLLAKERAGVRSFVPYHLIDVADPKDRFSVAEYQKMAYKAIEDVLGRGKLPIIVGGSGQYLEAIVEGYNLTEIKPNENLRAGLEEKSVEELFELLKEKNSAFAEKLNNSDKNNKRRLIRYVEVFNNKETGNRKQELKDNSKFNPENSGQNSKFFLLGLTYPKEILAARIHQRLIDRLEKEDMIKEVSDLHDKIGLSWERLEEFGLEYKFISQYLQEKIEYEKMVEMIDRSSLQFVKKQMTWFKRWEKKREIIWLEDKNEAEEKIKNFLDK